MSDMDRALSQLKDMLSNEEGQKQLENIIGSITGGGEPADTPGVPSSVSVPRSGSGQNSMPFNLNMDSVMKIKGIMEGMQSNDDPRVGVLSALRPYISSRGHHIDNAIKILSLGKLPALLKNFNTK